jgi:hypothetical protein
MAPPEIRVHALFRVALRYHALSLVDLRGDDSSLFRASYAASWRRTLARAGVPRAELDRRLAEAHVVLSTRPHRLGLHVEPLVDPDLGLDTGPLAPLESLLAGSYRTSWDDAADAIAACTSSFRAHVAARAPLLAPLRTAGIDRLHVHVCPALAGAGRATRVREGYAVAVPLPEDDEARTDAFLQLVHECCHPLTDDVVAPFLPAAGPDTARSSAGYAAHALREDAALVVGCHWLDDLPEHAAYLRWVARFRKGKGLAERLARALDLPEAARAAALQRAAAVRAAARPG